MANSKVCQLKTQMCLSKLSHWLVQLVCINGLKLLFTTNTYLGRKQLGRQRVALNAQEREREIEHARRLFLIRAKQKVRDEVR